MGRGRLTLPSGRHGGVPTLLRCFSPPVETLPEKAAKRRSQCSPSPPSGCRRRPCTMSTHSEARLTCWRVRRSILATPSRISASQPSASVPRSRPIARRAGATARKATATPNPLLRSPRRPPHLLLHLLRLLHRRRRRRRPRPPRAPSTSSSGLETPNAGSWPTRVLQPLRNTGRHDSSVPLASAVHFRPPFWRRQCTILASSLSH